jgi:hypothetical protein
MNSKVNLVSLNLGQISALTSPPLSEVFPAYFCGLRNQQLLYPYQLLQLLLEASTSLAG